MAVTRIIRFLIAVALLVLAVTAAAQTSRGPKKGTLIVIGGGQIGPEIIKRFTDLAGGPDAPVVMIPTTNDGEPTPKTLEDFKKRWGLNNVTMLHARKKDQANSKEFVAPLKKARGVFFPGGRQWRLADSYLGTRTEKELR